MSEEILWGCGFQLGVTLPPDIGQCLETFGHHDWWEGATGT